MDRLFKLLHILTGLIVTFHATKLIIKGFRSQDWNK